MGGNDQNNGKREQKQLINVPILLRKEKKHPGEKQQKRHRTAVVTGKSMAQGVYPDGPRKENHPGLKPEIMDDINPENRQTGQEQGQNGTMYRAGD